MRVQSICQYRYLSLSLKISQGIGLVVRNTEDQGLDNFDVESGGGGQAISDWVGVS
jgi:hypothetical protein